MQGTSFGQNYRYTIEKVTIRERLKLDHLAGRKPGLSRIQEPDRLSATQQTLLNELLALNRPEEDYVCDRAANSPLCLETSSVYPQIHRGHSVLIMFLLRRTMCTFYATI